MPAQSTATPQHLQCMCTPLAPTDARLDQAVERITVLLVVEELAVRAEVAGHVVRHARLELHAHRHTAGQLATDTLLICVRAGVRALGCRPFLPGFHCTIKPATSDTPPYKP